MNNMVQLWKNGNLLYNRMSSLIFHRYSVFSSTFSSVDSGKGYFPQGANQGVEMFELLNSFAFSPSTSPYPRRKVFASFRSSSQSLVWCFHSYFHFSCLLNPQSFLLGSPVHPSIIQCVASGKVPLLLLHLLM